MEEWMKKLRFPCAAAGGLCLLAVVWASLGLYRGEWTARAGVAAAVLVLAALALFLLRLEGFGRETLLVMLFPIGAAMLARVLCLDYASGDYNSFLVSWYQYFQENGGFAAIAHDVGDYNVPYLYFMALISYIPAPDLYQIKLFSILFDVVLAWGCLRLTRSLRGERQGSAAPLIAFGAALFLPTVVLNGAYWGQCDAIYGALVIHAVALVLEGRNSSSVALMALAFCFKLQTIFVLPLWGVLWLAKRVRFRELWVFPLTYLAAMLPAVLLGKPVGDILGVYVQQMGEYSRLTLNAPTVYQFLPYKAEIDENLASALGIAAAGVLVLVLLGVGLWLGRRLDRRAAFAAAVVLAIGVPFFLPHMHERYFFLADVLTLCWACSNLSRLPAAVLACGSSLASYRVYLRLQYNYTVWLDGKSYVMLMESFAMLAALAFSVFMLVRELKRCARGAPEGEWI